MDALCRTLHWRALPEQLAAILDMRRAISALDSWFKAQLYVMTQRHQLQQMCEEHSRDETLWNKYLVHLMFNGTSMSRRMAKLQPLADTKLPIASTEACRTVTFTSWRWLLMAHLWEETGGDNREIDLLFKRQQAPHHTQVHALYSGISRHIIKMS